MSQRVDATFLLDLQHRTENIRNFCILAHVDHGKTTLSDSLVSSNGIISSRLAGKLRFLDSTEEEQKRGITMHSSAIALYYRFEDRAEQASASEQTGNADYLINLVDSPGHIDFSSDVSTAARLCDGALIVVDVLEGVCTQTHAVIYKALKERMRPCLVLNKIDRLIAELRFSPTEAFHHLRRIIENVNALAFILVNSEYIKTNEANNTVLEDTTIPDDDPMVLEWTFAPEKGNVQFASALDGWGFGLMKFINSAHKKLGLNKGVLRKYLFEDYALNTETKKITKIEYNETDKQPMFATLVLAPIWKLYDTLHIQQDLPGTLDFAKNELGISLEKKEINTRDPRSTLQAIMRKWLPLADSLLRMVVRNMPNPLEAQRNRVETLMEPQYLALPTALTSKTASALRHVQSSIAQCSTSPDAPLVVFVSKMMPVRVADLSKRDVELLQKQQAAKARKESEQSGQVLPPLPPLQPEQEVFLALGRVFSGTLRRNSPIYVLGRKHDPYSFVVDQQTRSGDQEEVEEEIPEVLAGSITQVPTISNAETVEDLLGCYLLLGPSISPAESVPAGNIVGILGLEDYLLKTATLSDTWRCPPLKAITFQSKPMLKVAVEPLQPTDLPALERGLQQLNQFDPVVEVGIDLSGQRTMTCLGELHLDQCVKALVDKFAKCQLKVSEPLVSFRESVVLDETSHYHTTPVALEHPAVTAALAASTSTLFSSTVSFPAPNNHNSSNNIGFESAQQSQQQYGAYQLPPPWCDLPNLARAQQGYVRYTLDSRNVAVTIQAVPLPLTASNVLEQDVSGILGLDTALYQAYFQGTAASSPSTSAVAGPSSPIIDQYLQAHKALDKVWQSFLQATDLATSETGHGYHPALSQIVSEHVISLGPRASSAPSNLLAFHPQCRLDVMDDQAGLFFPATHYPDASNLNNNDANALTSNTAALSLSSVSPGATTTASPSATAGSQSGRVLLSFPLNPSTSSELEGRACFLRIWQRLHSAIVAGFQEATQAGPLMHEPMHSVAFVITKIEVLPALAENVLGAGDWQNCVASSSTGHPIQASSSSNAFNTAQLSSGQLISETKDHMRLALLSLPCRIVEPIFACNLQCDATQLGNLYAVLSKRRGTVYQEDIIEGTQLFVLAAYLPVANSFQFAQELLKKTSGAGTAPQLSFAHWQTMAADPFWRPRTEEELEEFGAEYYDEHNQARACIHSVRKRKGLAVDEQVVVSAEKQRTLKR